MYRHTKTLKIRKQLKKEAKNEWNNLYGEYFNYDENLRLPVKHILRSYKSRRWTVYLSESYNFKNFSRRFYKQEGVEQKNWYRKFEPEWNHLDREKRRNQKNFDKMNDDLLDYLDNLIDYELE